MFSSREEINAELLTKVQRDCERWGVAITRVEVFNITPPSDILQAMAKQITAERERRSNVLRADGERESIIIESRGQAAKIILDAEAVRASTVHRAKGAAEARKVMAAAEASCLSDVRGAVSPYGIRGVDYLTCIEYLNSLARLTSSSSAAATGPSRGTAAPSASSAKVVMVPVDTLDVMAAVMSFGRQQQALDGAGLRTLSGAGGR